MRKIVINKCWGGFGLSHEAILEYAKLKGITLYLEKKDSCIRLWKYWTVPENERLYTLSTEEWGKMSTDERIAYNKKSDEQVFYDRHITRDDEALVKVVEALGELSFGKNAELKIVEIPADVEWFIDDYDGMEHVAEKHRTWD